MFEQIIEQLRGKSIRLYLWNREKSCIEQIGGKSSTDITPMLLDLNRDWLVYGWEHSGEIVILPACNVVCISAVAGENKP